MHTEEIEKPIDSRSKLQSTGKYFAAYSIFNSEVSITVKWNNQESSRSSTRNSSAGLRRLSVVHVIRKDSGKRKCPPALNSEADYHTTIDIIKVPKLVIILLTESYW